MKLTLLFALVLTAAAGVSYAIFRRDIARARRRLSGSQIFNSESGPIEYVLRGSGPKILSIHGTGGGFDQGLDIAEPFIRLGFRVLAPSRFGYLRSSFPADPSPARQADALAQLLEGLELEPVAVVGFSAGAHTAIELALRHPRLLSALVLIVPSAYHPGKISAAPQLGRVVQRAFLLILRFDFSYWAAVRFAPRLMVRTILATDPAVVARASPDEQQRVMQVLWHMLPISIRYRGLRTDGEVAGSLGPSPLEQIATPTLTMSAPDDRYGTYPTAQYVAKRVQRGEFYGFPSGGHILAGRTEEMSQTVARFLKRSVKGP
jgi:pimeloyl-ACP methyl ester carboxylesterase